MPQFVRAISALIVAGAVLAPLTPTLAAPPHRLSLQELYLQNTEEGTVMAGNLKFSYRSAGRVIRHSCALYRCAYRLPTNTVVTLTQSPRNPNKYRFQNWRIQALGASSNQFFKKPKVLIVMGTGYTVTAEYVAKR